MLKQSYCTLLNIFDTLCPLTGAADSMKAGKQNQYVIPNLPRLRAWLQAARRDKMAQVTAT